MSPPGLWLLVGLSLKIRELGVTEKWVQTSSCEVSASWLCPLSKGLFLPSSLSTGPGDLTALLHGVVPLSLSPFKQLLCSCLPSCQSEHPESLSWQDLAQYVVHTWYWLQWLSSSTEKRMESVMDVWSGHQFHCLKSPFLIRCCGFTLMN